jgi:hypothetical protein
MTARMTTRASMMHGCAAAVPGLAAGRLDGVRPGRLSLPEFDVGEDVGLADAGSLDGIVAAVGPCGRGPYRSSPGALLGRGSGTRGTGDRPPVGPARPDAVLPRWSACGTCRRWADAPGGAIGGKRSPMEIPAVLSFAVLLWLA